MDLTILQYFILSYFSKTSHRQTELTQEGEIFRLSARLRDIWPYSPNSMGYSMWLILGARVCATRQFEVANAVAAEGSHFAPAEHVVI